MCYMTICIDLDKVNKESCTRFDGTEDTLAHIQNVLGYLKAHNKNYTQKQYWLIDELHSIFNHADIVKEEKEE